MSRFGVVIAALCAVFLATGLYACGGSTKTVTKTVTTSRSLVAGGTEAPAGVPPSVTKNYQQYDGKNPGPKCGFTGSLNAPYLQTVAKSIVKSAGGMPIGQLLLRHSIICRTETAEIVFKVIPIGINQVSVEATRRGRDYEVQSFATNSPIGTTYTSMLADGPSGCVFAAAVVEIAHTPGPRAETQCVRH